MILIAMIVKATTFFTYLLSITNVHICLYINSSNYVCNCSNSFFHLYFVSATFELKTSIWRTWKNAMTNCYEKCTSLKGKVLYVICFCHLIWLLITNKNWIIKLYGHLLYLRLKCLKTVEPLSSVPETHLNGLKRMKDGDNHGAIYWLCSQDHWIGNTKVGLSSSQKRVFICFNEGTIKLMKNTFFFRPKVLFILDVFTFLSWVLGYVEKSLD